MIKKTFYFIKFIFKVMKIIIINLPEFIKELDAFKETEIKTENVFVYKLIIFLLINGYFEANSEEDLKPDEFSEIGIYILFKFFMKNCNKQ